MMRALDNHINYVEFQAHDLETIKSFYNKTFGWTFTDYGPTYVSFSESGIAGGFEKTDKTIINGALIVLFHQNLESLLQKIKSYGGTIVQPVFSFPGGRRFHFQDPSGNELAVWSDLLL